MLKEIIEDIQKHELNKLSSEELIKKIDKDLVNFEGPSDKWTSQIQIINPDNL